MLMSKTTCIGVDEVGRGCLAGDLLVCAFAFKPGVGIEAVSRLAKDSKAFSSRKSREAVYKLLPDVGIFAIERRSPVDIDRLNIRGATLDAMRAAALTVRESVGSVPVFFDGKDVPDGIPGEAESVVKGDQKLLEISCASVIAKVLRDREMVEVSKQYPGYGFERNAGYGTKEHRTAIAKQGMTPVHRSWAAKFLAD